jgi:ketol-acid reductoisomerase
VKSGEETKRVLKSTGAKDYKQQLDKELKELRESELWRAGAASRALRPNVPESQRVKSTAGIGGRGKN